MKAFINLQALRNNLERITRLTPGEVIVAMVKANAYGHGLVAVTRFLSQQGVEHFGVATLEEAEALRKAGIKGAILLMSGAGFLGREQRLIDPKIRPLVSSIRELEALDALQTEVPVHLDIDTGMSRGGILAEEMPGLLKWWFQKKRHVKLEGLSTHFSDARPGDFLVSKQQLDMFKSVLELFKPTGLEPKVLHIANSGVILNIDSIHGDNIWVRPGIALYGACAGFEPVMSLKAPVTLIKTIRAGSTVGYHQTWRAERDTCLALVRAGYGDGYRWALSNKAQVLIRGRRVPVIGLVSMDLITVDVTDIDCEVGDPVTLMGQDGDETITAQDLAQICGTISYEILTGISERVDRVYQ